MHRRSTRNLLCRFFAGVLLYAQLAVAAYACPGPAAMATPHDTGTASAPMPGCDAMMTSSADAGASNLCAEHCHQGQQSDHVQTVSVAPAVFAGTYPLPLAPALAVPLRAMAFSADARAAAPPHAILHCCFRI